MTTPEPARRRPVDLVAVLFAYVLPLGLVVGGLFAVGLPQLAVALLVIELATVVAVVLVRRRPLRTGPAEPSSRPWLVPTVMALLMAGIVAVGVLASHAG